LHCLSHSRCTFFEQIFCSGETNTACWVYSQKVIEKY
jgi:hypothetical protein